MDNAKNFAKVTTDGPYDDVETVVSLIGGDGAKLPTAPFNAVWWNATDYPDPADDPSVEIVRVTAIATDALTVSRGEETAAFEHQLGGKLYRMAAGLTAKAINDLSPVVAPFSWQGDVFKIQVGAGKEAAIGDPDAEGNATVLRVQDSAGKIVAEVSGAFIVVGKLGTSDSASATVGVGTISKKLPVYADDGTTLLGYIPIYDAIT